METKFSIGPLSRDDVDVIMGSMEYVRISAHGKYLEGNLHIKDGDICIEGFLNALGSEFTITVPTTFKATDIAIWFDSMFSEKVE